ncbi:DUF1800 domain-containing protein [Aquabacterium sp. A7-Y]|uniref:DUF1800 domain-containing protein n=1 Tax=Aquabacterium sp. A7-Y TaxID=1349605 RepID=UPI00223DC7A8|nr:DUF1800 domain-containing protein [Aquabacterium sp. A7-Y]MCW7539587.1 DUF1800 domain-containing protein [Aquabacterium sp. A7-Y]
MTRPCSAWPGRRAARALQAAALCLLMAACGGGDHDSSNGSDSDGNSGGGGGGDDRGVVSERPASRYDAARFLTQASFGPTGRSVDSVMERGYAGWIDAQFRLPYTPVHRRSWEASDAALKAADPERNAGQREVLDSFWRQALTGEDQLRQRVAYALSQIFVISTVDGNVADRPRGVASYMDVLAQHAFGNYRELLEAVTRHPMMGTYLSHLRNQKEDPAIGRVPDQNFAREVMQLFSIGLHDLRPDGSVLTDAAGRPRETYDSEDIVGLSRVFTGFSWHSPSDDDACFYGMSQCQDPDRFWRPMRVYAKFHSGAQKRFLGRTLPASHNPDPEAGLRIALDTLFRHPNVGPFIGRQLIQRLVTSNPSPAYVARVSAAFDDNGQGVRGDLKAVVKAILLDPEARDARAAQTPGYGKLREPVLRLSAFLRAYGASSASGRFLVGMTDDPGRQLGQTPMRAPSVFNFYRPGYVPPNTGLARAGLVAPEMQITHETTVAGYANYMRDAVLHGVGQRGLDYQASANDIQPDYRAEMALADRPDALLDRVAERLLLGRMPASLRSEIRLAVSSIAIPQPHSNGSNAAAIESARRSRVHTAVYLTLLSPEFIVQK